MSGNNEYKLNQFEPKLYPWRAQSRTRASAPIQSDQRAESEPELYAPKFMEPSQAAQALGILYIKYPNQKFKERFQIIVE